MTVTETSFPYVSTPSRHLLTESFYLVFKTDERKGKVVGETEPPRRNEYSEVCRLGQEGMKEVLCVHDFSPFIHSVTLSFDSSFTFCQSPSLVLFCPLRKLIRSQFFNRNTLKSISTIFIKCQKNLEGNHFFFFSHHVRYIVSSTICTSPYFRVVL